MFDQLKDWVATHRVLTCGIFSIFIGVFIVIGSVLRWKWLVKELFEYRRMSLLSAALYEKYGVSYLRIRNIMLGSLLLIMVFSLPGLECRLLSFSR